MSSADPIEAAGAVLLDGEGRVLLVKENYDRRRWGFPGGAVESGETAAEAVVREVREETSLDVEIESLVGSYALADSPLTMYVYRCAIVAGEPQMPESGEIAEIRWCASDDLPSPRTNLLHHALPDALAGRTAVERDDLPRIS